MIEGVCAAALHWKFCGAGTLANAAATARKRVGCSSARRIAIEPPLFKEM
jgi:hypothetical protein